MQIRSGCAALLIGAVMVSSPSVALDPGTANGLLKIDSDAVILTHAYAHLHDNAEGWLDKPEEMRILVTDREIDPAALAGMNPFFTLSTMVREGSVRGLLIRFDPGKPKSVMVTVLYPPKEQNHTLANKMLSNSEESPLEKLRISDLRVSAAMKQSSEGNRVLEWPAESYQFSLSAPLFKEPAVTATMKGKQVLNSPQAKAILATAAAMIRGDLAKVKQLSTERKIRQIETSLARMSPEEMKSMMIETGKQMQQSVKKGRLKLVVRGERASLMVEENDGKAMFGLIRKNGAWTLD